MIINSTALLHYYPHAPIKNMIDHKVHEHGVSHGLGEAGYDIRIAQTIIFIPGSTHWSGPIQINLPDRIQVNTEPPEDGRFIIASAMEEFDMPPDLVGIVHDKSTWARQGLSVFNTVIEPGWKGFLTLELVFHGKEHLVIPAGAGIAQVVFHRTAQHAYYEGKYQNQENKPVAARES